MLAAGVLFALAGLGFGVYGWTQTARGRGSATAGGAPSGAEAIQAAFVAVADRVRPAVVNIGTVQVSRARRAPLVPGPGTPSRGRPRLKAVLRTAVGCASRLNVGWSCLLSSLRSGNIGPRSHT